MCPTNVFNQSLSAPVRRGTRKERPTRFSSVFKAGRRPVARGPRLTEKWGCGLSLKKGTRTGWRRFFQAAAVHISCTAKENIRRSAQDTPVCGGGGTPQCGAPGFKDGQVETPCPVPPHAEKTTRRVMIRYAGLPALCRGSRKIKKGKRGTKK